MTQEGIIQKVFNEYRNRASKRLDGIDGLEQALIKEITHGIRREVNNPESDFYIAPEDAELLIKYLIGETKE